MKRLNRTKLESKGWKVGTVSEFLGLTPGETAYIELKLELARDLQKKRRASRLTQTDLARRLKSSQSRVAKMESGDPSVTIDLLVRSLLALGSTKKSVRKRLTA